MIILFIILLVLTLIYMLSLFGSVVCYKGLHVRDQERVEMVEYVHKPTFSFFLVVL